MGKVAIWLITVGGFLILSACSKTAPDTISDKSAAVADRAVDLPDYVSYDVAMDPKEIAKRTGSPCAMNMCVFQAYPKEAPLKKHNGTELCILPEYESQSVLQGYFNRDDKLVGMGCTISREDYDSIASRYRSQAVTRYLNQRGVFEDFRTYQTRTGFITTYTEIMGSAPNGDVKYTYHVYVGPEQHPHYSEYVSN